jgi:hypothetical protein
MINEIALHGTYESLVNAKLTSDYGQWSGNCFGVNFHCYSTEMLNDEQLKTLNKKYDSVSGLMRHELFYKNYSGAVQQWFEGMTGDLLSSLGLTIQKQDESHELELFSKQSATRQTLVYAADDILDSVLYILDANSVSLADLPDIVKTSEELENNSKERNGVSSTIGGDDHEVNPINGSNIIYATTNYSVIIGQVHCLQQFYNFGSFSQLLSNIHFIKSSISEPHVGLYKTMANHLQVDLRFLDAD